MPLPIDNLTSVHLDAATDDPSQARVELLAVLNKLREVIAVLDDGAGGGVNADFLRGFGAATAPGANIIPVHDASGRLKLSANTAIGSDVDSNIDMSNVLSVIKNGLINYNTHLINNDIYFTRNAKYVSGGWVRMIDGYPQGFSFGLNGNINFLTSANGPAGSAISWIVKLFVPTAAGAAMTYDGNAVWHAGNDGASSGLDADLVRGLASATAATPNTVVVRGAAGQTSIRGSRFHGDAGSDSYIATYETSFTQGNPAAQVVGADATGSVLTATFDAISGSYTSPPGRAALVIGRNTATGRSIAALGTLVASGADYAEYEIKSDECGTVAKGQIVGFDASGKITDKWANALSFGIKTTAPSYVGGDTWGTPDVIGCEYPMLPVEPCEPQCLPTPKSLRHAKHRHDEAVRHADMAKAALAAIQKDVDKEVFDQAQKNLVAAELAMTEAAATLCDEEDRAKNAQEKIDSDHRAACEKYTADCETYKADKAIYDERLAAARSKVDRVAYSGKVPCNVEGAVPGDYIVPVMASGGGISGKAISEQNITFAEYRRAVGRVRKILDDGRPEVVVIVH